MNLRIWRTYSWQPSRGPGHLVLGGQPHLALVAHDELQCQTEAGDWVAVPVMEDEAPPHPRTVQPVMPLPDLVKTAALIVATAHAGNATPAPAAEAAPAISSEIEAKVRKSAAVFALQPADALRLEHKIIDDLGLDSLDQMEFVMDLESEFDIEIPDEDAMGAVTLADAIRLVAQGLARKAAHRSAAGAPAELQP